MIQLLLALALQQPQVVVQVDRDEVLVGGELSITIIVTASGTDRVLIDDPDFRGLELLDQRQQTRVSMADGVPRRVTTRELTLRAVQAGVARIGAVRVRQGDQAAESPPLEITVRAPDVAPATALSALVQPLLQRGPPDLPPDDVVLTVLRSPDAVIVGQQLDLVAVAWFPRDLRARLRNPPAVDAPEVRGAWVYPRPAPAGVALSRSVNGRWYDLFVLHEVVFPLTAGTLEIGPASVSFSVPVSGSFLSRELRREARSEPSSVIVEPLPAGGVGTAFAGAIGRDLEISMDVPSVALRKGDAARVRIEVSGLGNVSLWPEPQIEWPSGVRAYQQEVMVSIASRNGLIGGSKAYEYLVVADSVGTHRVPSVRYTYFDTDAREYVPIGTEGFEFLTPGEVTTTAPLRAVQPLVVTPARNSADWLLDTVPLWIWLLVLLIPPTALFAARRRVRGSTEANRRRTRSAGRRSRLNVLDSDFSGVLDRLVPGVESKAGADLANALRAAGIETTLAAHVARVRDRLRHALYGPEGAADAEELVAEVQEVLRALAGEPIDASAPATLAHLVVALTLGWAPVVGQTPAQLYQAGATRMAADSFAARTTEEPYVAAHWLNLGYALDRLGQPAMARAAWIRAGRLAPRNAVVRRTLETAPLPDAVSDRLVWLSPATPGEALLGAVLCWIIGWTVLGLRMRARYVIVAFVIAVGAGAYGAYVLIRYAEPTALILEAGTPLRAAPYGSARAAVELEEASAVRVEQTWGSWRLVSHGAFRGWVLSSEMLGL